MVNVINVAKLEADRVELANMLQRLSSTDPDLYMLGLSPSTTADVLRGYIETIERAKELQRQLDNLQLKFDRVTTCR